MWKKISMSTFLNLFLTIKTRNGQGVCVCVCVTCGISVIYRGIFLMYFPAVFTLLTIIGASLSKPHTCQTAYPRSIYLSMIYRTSFRKCPAFYSILQCVIQFHKCHHVQIIQIASILHVWWAYSTTNECTFDSQLDTAWSFHRVDQLQLPWSKQRVGKRKSCTVLDSVQVDKMILLLLA